MTRKIIAVVGQTTTGKSDLAVELAIRFNGEIVSADSRQVYKKLDLSSGKITFEEMRGVAHHMLDVSDISHVYTVAEYCAQARKIIEDIFKRNKTPIICGGTGLYFDALFNNYDFDEIEPNEELRMFFEGRSHEENVADLLKLNENAKENIDLDNPRRVERALEKIYQLKNISNNPYLSTQKTAQNDDLLNEPLVDPFYDQIIWIGLKREPDILRKAISERLERRISSGMIEEIKNILNDGIDHQRLEQLGLEFKYISKYLANEITLEEMKDTLVLKIRQYAKRQLTWFKRNPKINWLNPDENAVVTRSIEIISNA